jgi:hypothetical protein
MAGRKEHNMCTDPQLGTGLQVAALLLFGLASLLRAAAQFVNALKKNGKDDGKESDQDSDC